MQYGRKQLRPTADDDDGVLQQKIKELWGFSFQWLETAMDLGSLPLQAHENAAI